MPSLGILQRPQLVSLVQGGSRFSTCLQRQAAKYKSKAQQYFALVLEDLKPSPVPKSCSQSCRCKPAQLVLLSLHLRHVKVCCPVHAVASLFNAEHWAGGCL